MATTVGLAIVFLALLIVTAVFAIRYRQKSAEQAQALLRFQKILDVEAHVAHQLADLEPRQGQRVRDVDAYVAQQKSAFEQDQRSRADEVEQQISLQKRAFEQLQHARMQEIDEYVAKQRAEADRSRNDIEIRVS